MGSVLAASSPNPPPPASGGGAAAAAVPGLTVPPGFGMPPVSSVIPPSEAASGQQQEAAENPLPNPGAFDECHRKCKGEWKHRLTPDREVEALLVLPCLICMCVFLFSEVFPMQMEGVRLVVNKGLSNHFQVCLVSSLTDKIKPDNTSKAPETRETKLWMCNRVLFSLQGESHCAAEHHGRFHLQVWCYVRWNEADGSSRGTPQ